MMRGWTPHERRSLNEDVIPNRAKIHLAHKEFSPENPPVILLHGLTSSKETWDACAEVIAHRTGSKVYSYDARNHGDSEWCETHTYRAMAEDLADFMDSMGIPKAVVIGHSMGGKTSMEFALRFPEKLHSLVVEDITLTRVRSTKEIVLWYIDRMKKFLKEVPPNTDLKEAKRMAARYLAGRDLSETGGEEVSSTGGGRVWDGSELPLRRKSGGGFVWKTNLEVLEDSMKSGNMGPVTTDGFYHGPVLVLYGTKSPFRALEGKDLMLKHFPNTVHVPVEGGSHILHSDFPDLFNDLVCDFILKHRK